MLESNPLAVPCPYCQVSRGHLCESTSADGRRRPQNEPHALRVEWAKQWAAWHGDVVVNVDVPPL